MKNKLEDLVNHCFVALERLNDEALDADKIQAELKRAHAVAAVAREIISAGRLAVDAHELIGNPQAPSLPGPRLLGLSGTDTPARGDA
jgi:hypothetical protein